MSDFHDFGLTWKCQKKSHVVARLPQRLKSTLFEIFSNGGCPKGTRSDFSLWGKQCVCPAKMRPKLWKSHIVSCLLTKSIIFVVHCPSRHNSIHLRRPIFNTLCACILQYYCLGMCFFFYLKADLYYYYMYLLDTCCYYTVNTVKRQTKAPWSIFSL